MVLVRAFILNILVVLSSALSVFALGLYNIYTISRIWPIN